MADVPYIWFRGKRMTRAFRDAILAAEQRAGFQFVLTQGGFNAGGVAASAGTHDGDAGDWSIRGLNRDQVAAMIEALRWAGIAAWLRTGSVPLWETRAQYFSSAHVHGVPNGWGLPSAGARSQADAYRRGRDGLRANLPDIGPGHVKTWYSQTTPRKPITPGLPPAGVDNRSLIERYLDDMDDQKFLELAELAVSRVLWAPLIAGRTDIGGSSVRNNILMTALRVEELAKRAGVDVDEKAIAQGVADALGPVVEQLVTQAAQKHTDPAAIAAEVRKELAGALSQG